MSYTDGKAGYNSAEDGRPGPRRRKHFLGVVTLAGALELTDEYRELLKLDPGGNHRDVTLGTSTHVPGRYFRIVNTADAAENLVVKNAQGDTIVTINQNEQAELYYSDELNSANDADNWVLISVYASAQS